MPIKQFPAFGPPYAEDGMTYPPVFEPVPGGRIVRLTSGTAATWTVPVGVKLLKWIYVLGGGGGGGGGYNKASGASGGYGGYPAWDFMIRSLSVSPGDVFTYTIGAGGAGLAQNTSGTAQGSATTISWTTSTGTPAIIRSSNEPSATDQPTQYHQFYWDSSSYYPYGGSVQNGNYLFRDGIKRGVSLYSQAYSGYFPGGGGALQMSRQRASTFSIWLGTPGTSTTPNASAGDATFGTPDAWSSAELGGVVVAAAGSNGGVGSGGTGATAASGGAAGYSGGGGAGGGASTAAAGTGQSAGVGGGGGGGGGRFIATGTTAITGGAGGNASVNSGAGGGGGGGANTGGTGTTTGGTGGNGGSGIIIICY